MHNSKYVNVEINGFRRSYYCVLQILFVDKIGKIGNIYNCNCLELLRCRCHDH